MMKKALMPILVGTVAAISLLCGAYETQSAISREVIRLHVRANSNTPEDQALKLCVRDAILQESKNIASGCSSAKEAEERITDNIDKLLLCAKTEISDRGYSYPVRVRMGKSPFPAKEYGDMTLPAGTYNALTVEIGEGSGENWWCVMFPPLCFTEETITDSSRTDKILLENLDAETYSMIKQKGFKVKFKIYESILNAKSKLQSAKLNLKNK